MTSAVTTGAGPSPVRPAAVAGLLLAAGGGRRYGRPKALVAVGGRLLVERGAAVLRAAGCRPVIVVLGAVADEVRSRADLTGAMLVDNPGWAAGMGSSLRAGLAAAAGTGCVAVVVTLVDMPGVTAEAVARVAAHAGPGSLATASYADRRGHPVLLGREHWAGVSALAEGDVGARPYLATHHVIEVPCADVADPTDIDTPAAGPAAPGGCRPSAGGIVGR